MNQVISVRSAGIYILFSLVIVYACSKGGGSNSPSNACAGINIIVSGTTTNPTAPALSNGSIIASASGSSGFTFSLNGGAFQSSGSFSNLAAGSYTITAKNADGCSGSNSFTLTASNNCPGVTITVTATLTNPSAPGATNGSIAASASGGTGTFTFSVNGGAFQASGTFTGLVDGTYTITAKDGNGCTGSNTFTLAAPNPCSGVTITLSNAVTSNTPCQGGSTGSVTVTPSGGTGPYTFSFNGGAFQPGNTFSNLNAGSYSVSAKDANGCIGVAAVTVNNITAGPLFSDVRTVLQNNCVSCHNSSIMEGGMNWTVDCNIVTFKDRIKARAVDGNPSPMPPTGFMPASERQKITNWINAGGRYTD